jgi:hypothetical protein
MISRHKMAAVTRVGAVITILQAKLMKSRRPAT